MNPLSSCAESVDPATPAVPAPAILDPPTPAVPVAVVGQVLLVAGAARVGSCGTTLLEAAVPVINGTPGVGIAAAELTPRLAISQESSGSPVRGTPPGVVGVVDVGADDDAAMPFDPEPHIPDNDTGPVAVVVDIPEIGSNPGSADIADAGTPLDMPAVAVLPAVAAVAAAPDPIVSPPPS